MDGQPSYMRRDVAIAVLEWHVVARTDMRSRAKNKNLLSPDGFPT